MLKYILSFNEKTITILYLIKIKYYVLTMMMALILSLVSLIEF